MPVRKSWAVGCCEGIRHQQMGMVWCRHHLKLNSQKLKSGRSRGLESSPAYRIVRADKDVETSVQESYEGMDEEEGGDRVMCTGHGD